MAELCSWWHNALGFASCIMLTSKKSIILPLILVHTLKDLETSKCDILLGQGVKLGVNIDGSSDRQTDRQTSTLLAFSSS
jgi:hypothetical protein